MQCKDNPEGDVKAICDALAKLEANATADQTKLEGEIKDVEAEQKKNNEWQCDCAYAAWAEWGQCSGTCGDTNTRDRLREVERQPRNGGVPCKEELLSESETCNKVCCRKYTALFIYSSQ